MYVGVDVGGTKTLVAVLDEHGVIKEQAKFPTPKKYEDFLLELRHALAHFKTKEFAAGGIGIPGRIDREHHRAVRLGNVKTWGENLSIPGDIEKITNCPIVMENDAKMAGLSEAMLLKNDYARVLYVTVSTGIGTALIDTCRIDTNFGDAGGNALLLDYKGKPTPWENFASGHAIVERFGKRAEDIHDAETWKIIAHDLAKGFIELIALVEPEVIVIGGSVGTFFDRYGELLQKEIEKYHVPLVQLPKLLGAQRPEEAVIYGCYDLAKQEFPHASAH
ncbi:MAG TPA: ROK family protein [Candidatus Saccharimonadales bacterium]